MKNKLFNILTLAAFLLISFWGVAMFLDSQKQTKVQIPVATPELTESRIRVFEEYIKKGVPFVQRNEVKVKPVEQGQIVPSLCKVTWYGNEFHGRLSANGEVFDEYGMTAASNTLAFGTVVRIYANGKSVDVRITDRGGFAHCFDLSKGAFEKLAPLSQGVLYVDYEIL